MSSYLLSIFIFIVFLLPEVLSGSNIKILTTSKDIFIPPAIAENGKSFVYTGFDEETRKPAIFVAYRNSDGNFSKPVAAVTTETIVKSLGESLISFPYSGLYSHVGFNSPTIQDDIITFCSILKSWKKGVFYGIKNSGRWTVSPIVLQGDDAPETSGLFFRSFYGAYISINSEIIFLTVLNDSSEAIYAFKITPSQNTMLGKVVQLYSSDDNIYDFYNLSVAQGNFAIRADDPSGKTFIYVYSRKDNKLVKTAPDEYGEMPQGHRITIKGPSFFDGKIAYSAYGESHDRKPTYAIYTNAGNNNFSVPIIVTGKMIPSLNVEFSKVWNPTLSIKNNKAYIAFMGYNARNDKYSGVYFACIENGEVTLKSIAVPGQEIGDHKVIKSAEIGAVSMRDGIIPMAIKLKSGESVIAVTKVY
ncbi:MAG: hypothetical protein GY750_14345 [Lentisphaerae bacterium]|nr:hypothetical protein [Lentisphaerota bacterium]MCP4102581.1 hypothetical protein [Lentisphaerota bacterium]